jgi:hypothetical protein
MDESGHECDTALSLDPGNYQFRSCAFTFDQLGNYARAMDFLQLDAGSEWSVSNVTRHYIRNGDLSRARETIQKEAYKPHAQMMIACMDAPSSANASKLSREMSAQWPADPDPEVRYEVAPDFLVCGQRALAFSLLKSSIVAGHFCAYSGLQNDSVFAPLRGTPEFTQLVASAKQCQSDFFSQRSQAAH